jgi:hypothetical protein
MMRGAFFRPDGKSCFNQRDQGKFQVLGRLANACVLVFVEGNATKPVVVQYLLLDVLFEEGRLG